MSSEFVYGEAALAETLGVARLTVKNARVTALKEGEDWNLAGHEVAYTAEAVPELLKVLGIRMNKKRPKAPGGMTVQVLLEKTRLGPVEDLEESKKGPAVLWRPRPQVLEVARPTKNKRILLAKATDPDLAPRGKRYLGADGELLRVRVRDGSRFSKGMVIRCTHVQADLWEFTGRAPKGPRDPRYRPGTVR